MLLLDVAADGREETLAHLRSAEIFPEATNGRAHFPKPCALLIWHISRTLENRVFEVFANRATYFKRKCAAKIWNSSKVESKNTCTHILHIFLCTIILYRTVCTFTVPTLRGPGRPHCRVPEVPTFQ